MAGYIALDRVRRTGFTQLHIQCTMFAHLPSYLLFFSRLVAGLVFAFSTIGKLRDLPAFYRAVTNFRILPQRSVRLVSCLFVLGELFVVAAMLLGDLLLLPGFLLAAALLVLFSIALASVLARNLHIPCNCFGAAEKPISGYDLLRNAGLFGCALLGLISFSGRQANLGAAEITLLGLMAVTFAVLWINIEDLTRLF